MSVYQPSIPTVTVKFSADYLNIQGNFSVLDTSYGINHFAFSNTSSRKGKHKFVDMPFLNTSPSDTTPPTSLIPGDGGLYVAIPISKAELFYSNDASGRAFQMTNTNAAGASGFATFAENPGWTFLPGGLIMQWGSVASTTTGSFTDQIFPIPFPGGCYNVFTQVYGNSSAPSAGGEANVTIRKSTLSGSNITKFNWAYVTGSAQYTGFFWWALGF